MRPLMLRDLDLSPLGGDNAINGQRLIAFTLPE